MTYICTYVCTICLNNFNIMQISENLLRVIFMLSTIVAMTDCCSSRLLLLKEHTLQIVQQHRLHNVNSADNDYENLNYDQLLQQQQHHHQQQLEQQQEQQQKITQYVDLLKSELEFNKNYTDEHTRSRDDNEETTTEAQVLGETMQLGNFGSNSFESLLGIFDAAVFMSTTNTTTTPASDSTTKTTATTTTTTKTENTSPEQSTTSIGEESSTQAVNIAVVDAETGMEDRSTTISGITTMPTTNTTAAAATLHNGEERVMNDSKLPGAILSMPCRGQYNTEFCLNRGRCFRYPIGKDIIHSCICADGYMGERCDSKSMNGSFIPAIPGANKNKKILMARIVFSFPMLVALSVIYIMIGAAVVFKRPATPTPTPSPTSAEGKELFELLPDDDAGEFIMMNSYPIAAGAASYSAYTD